MATSDMTITVEVKVRGERRMQIAIFVARFVRPARLALWIVKRLVVGVYGADIKVGDGEWQRGPRAEVTFNGD